jgi:hypothetical protein
LSILNQMVHSGFITEEKDVAGMAEQNPADEFCQAYFDPPAGLAALALGPPDTVERTG